MKHVLESDIEAECMRLVRKAGGEHRKLDVGAGAKGWLDQAVWLPGWHFIVEFKRPGGKLSALQTRRIARLRALEHEVYVIDNVPDFESLLTRRTFA